jgi:hypothetical protein
MKLLPGPLRPVLPFKKKKSDKVVVPGYLGPSCMQSFGAFEAMLNQLAS